MAEPKISALCLTHVWVINSSEVKHYLNLIKTLCKIFIRLKSCLPVYSAKQ